MLLKSVCPLCCFISALPLFKGEERLNLKRQKHFWQVLELAEAISQQADAAPIAKELADKLMARKQDILDAWNINAHLDGEQD